MSARFGWCMDGRHSACTGSFQIGPQPQVCGCPCHTAVSAVVVTVPSPTPVSEQLELMEVTR